MDNSSLFFNRYDRQRKVLGEELDNKIHKTSIAVFGLGGLGSWLSEFLARMGVKRIYLIDYGLVDLPDLHRQGYTENDIGRPKAYVMYEKLKKINSTVEYIPVFSISEKTILEVFENVDLVFDATDNLISRKMIEYYSKKYNKPWVFGAVSGYIGYSAIFSSESCFEYIFGSKKPFMDPKEYGIIITTILHVVSIQITLFLKWLTGKQDKNLYIINAKVPKIEKANISKVGDCKPEKIDPEQVYRSLKNIERILDEIEQKNIIKELEQYDPVEENEFYIRYSINGKNIVVFRSGEIWISKIV